MKPMRFSYGNAAIGSPSDRKDNAPKVEENMMNSPRIELFQRTSNPLKC